MDNFLPDRDNTMKKAVCVLVKIGSAYLTVSRPNSNLVGLVGGKVDPGEVPLESIVREVKEEIGLDLNPDLFTEVFTEICPGDVDYLTTAFIYPDLENSVFLDIKPEPGLTCVIVTKGVLCDSKFTPFAEYNSKLFTVIEE